MEKMKEIDLKIPDLGEAESTEIIEMNISVGEKIQKNDPLIVLESEKAAMEIPSDFDGEIIEIYVENGQSVTEGQIFAKIKSIEAPDNIPEKLNETKELAVQSKKEDIDLSNVNISLSGFNAGPAVRKYARELEIDLSKINGSGRGGKITKEDLKNYIHSGSSLESFFKTSREEDFKDIGKYSIEELSKIRSIAAKNLHQSWVSIPHVTHFEDVEMTSMLDFKKSKKVSVLTIVINSISKALERFPLFNSSLLEKNRILVKKEINIGVAVDTEMGLVVPVIKNVNKKTVYEINNEILDLAEKARNKKLLTKNLEGATFTVSSLGKIGGTSFTPIINPPEVGIIGISRSKRVLSMTDAKEIFAIEMLPLTLSYDHRVINGADAGEFMLFIKESLESLHD